MFSRDPRDEEEFGSVDVNLIFKMFAVALIIGLLLISAVRWLDGDNHKLGTITIGQIG